MADDMRLSENIEAEFNPLVVIVADDPERYSSFAQLFLKNGFECRVYGELPEEMVDRPQPGTIFFVSFNLKESDAALLARRIEQRNNLCIVFAEQEGIETAAKLSSAKLTQTLQHPYTEKNFLMAVQTIVKKRRVQYEKEIRKQTVLDRRKGMTDGAAEEESSPDALVFKAEPKEQAGRGPLIFEDRHLGKKFEAVMEGRGYLSGHSLFTRDRRRRGLMEIQKGIVGSTFTVMPSASRSRGSPHVSGGRTPSAEAVSLQNSRSSPAKAPPSVTSASPSAPTRSEIQTGPATENQFALQEGSPSSGPSSAGNGDQNEAASVVSSSAARTRAQISAMGAVAGEGFSRIQKGVVGALDGALQRAANGLESLRRERSGTSTSGASAADASVADREARKKREGEVLVGYKKEDLLDGERANPLVAGDPLPSGERSPKPAAPPVAWSEEKTTIAGPIAVPTWALIAAATIGILLCLFFLYMMVFRRHG